MKKTINIEHLMLLILSVLIIFIPFRELFAHYTLSAVKSIPDILVLLVFAAYLVSIRFRIRLDKCDLLFGAYLLFEFISTVLINHIGLKPYILQVRSITLYYVLFYVLKNYQFSSALYQKIIPVIKTVVYLLFALALIEKLFAKTILFPTEWKESIIYMDNYIRTYGVFNNPNTYAAFILFSFIYVYQQMDDFWHKKNWFFIFACICGLLLTVSRSALLLFGCFILALGITQAVLVKKQKKLKLIALKPFVICLVAAMAVWGGAEVFSDYYMEQVVFAGTDSVGASSLDRFNELVGDKIINVSQTNGRLFSITKGIEIVQDYPIFGTGFGTYGSSASLICGSPLYEKYDIEGSFYSDNEYIKILVEGGMIGFLIFACFLISILYTYRKQPFKILVCIVMGGLGLFYNIFEVQILALLFWMSLAAPLRNGLKGAESYDS